MEIRTSTVHIPNLDLQIEAYLAQPMAAGTYPAVIVFQEVFGVNAHIREVTERIAQEGYLAIAPAIYQRTAPGFDVGYNAADLELGRYHKDQTTAAQLLSDTTATITYLQTLPNFKPGAIACLGFCFGGHVAYLAATLPAIRATACFYGAGIATFTPGGGAPTITRTPEIQGTVYGFFGTRDPLIPVEQIDQIEAALATHQIPHQIYRYPVGHGFFCNQRPDYHPEAAADAWMQLQQLWRTAFA
ncbi:carboxymethylenebutenolidase [Neosynechococcus sphagnicola sy1]|uniref:Carboxymethylenebutenolidase n=1 Tax=Neosynechococcus sphagnicola sy1 TaxID=1497020 RepID=A0A098TSD7_9CYAN|nr:dienelactone hydrolase family protein [Neosynechococcus sphagnicola]KGF73678.1 carboxymethylenebutenolidase [Neosynechococcus sphagnicola sy1]